MKKLIPLFLILLVLPSVSFGDDPTKRLTDDISSVCPINGISIGKIGDSSTVKINFIPTATANQKQSAQGIVDNFKWVKDVSDLKQDEILRIDAQQITAEELLNALALAGVVDRENIIELIKKYRNVDK